MPYKVVETSAVTDEELEKILNEWTAKGYAFESIQFVTSVSSKRPTMAFVFFIKDETFDTPCTRAHALVSAGRRRIKSDKGHDQSG